MAVKINLTDGTGSKTADFKQEKTPATQGNVINTLDAYNEKIKKEYYDKNQARADENALQESIQKIVELLAKDTSFKNKTKPANTKSEDTEADRLEGYLGGFDEDKKLAFDAAGLVRKINVIANLLSGNTDSNKGWAADVHGNNAGKNNSSLNAPVIGITRENPEYSATIDKDTHELIISGLNEVVKDGEEDNVDVSDITVLSEKQVAHMISNTIRETLGTYDSQISNILAYLLIKDDLTEAQKYVLLHTYTEMTNEAPLFITYGQDEFTTNGTKIVQPHYYIHDLNGGNYKEETKDFFIYENQYEAEKSPFLVKLSESDSEKLEVSVDGNLGYYIPIPQKTVTVDVGSIDDITGFSYDLSLFGKKFETRKAITFKDGVFSINAPIGAKVTIHIPTDFIGDFFETNDNTDQNHRVNDEVVISNIEENVEIYTKNITYNVEIDKQTITQKKRFTEYFSIEITDTGILKAGYNSTATYGTVDRDNSKITLSIDNIINKVDLVKNTVINDTVNFSPKTGVTVTVKNFDDDHLIGTQENQTVGEKLWYDLYENKFTGKKLICFYDENKDNEISTIPESDKPVVYAKYETLVYNDSFILNGGSWSTGQIPSETHEYISKGDDNTIIRPVKDGYTFLGWYTTPNFETLGEGSVGCTGYLNEDCTYYARWEENTYTINFYLDGLLNGANPQFKYQSISVKTSNLPLTLGKAYADGYEFKGWAPASEITDVVLDAGSEENYVVHDTIRLSDFINNGTTEISLKAVWSTSDVDIIEEYYYEVEGQTGKYDLLETSKKEAKVGTTYEKATYSPNVGFEEKEDKEQSNFTVMPTGNVYKRYFDRASFTVTYKGVESEAEDVQYTYSDNAQELKSVDNKLFDCWLKVETDENGNVTNKTPIKQISAYHFSPLILEARYNQNAPVLGTDFTVTTDFDKITISAKSVSGKIFVNSSESEQPKEITDSSPVVFEYSNVYSSGVNTTKSCFVYFEGNEDTNRNPSDQVEVPLIYNNEPPVIDQDFELESATSTVRKKVDGLEYRIGSSTKYLDLTSDLTIGRTDTIYIRRKETFSRFASEEVSGSFTGKQDAATDALVRTNFTVEGVSYKTRGSIEIAAAVFQGNHGALQYQTGSGNAWLDVNRTGVDTSPTTLYVDKPCTVSFRYNESDEYLASSQTVEVLVGIKTHTVTFDTSDINYSTYNFEGLNKVEGLAKKFTLTVPSGSQLCKVDNYIKNVNNWTITGYTKNIDSSLGRAVSFLKKEDGSQYNEASIVDDDITLLMNWAAAKFDVTYTDAVLLDGTELSLPSELLTNYRKTFYYGQNVVIDLINNLASLADYESTLVSILNNLDKTTDKILSFRKLYYKTGNKEYTNTGAEVNKNHTTWTFDYFGKNGTPDFSATLESFPYKFASKFEFVESTAENAQIQFYNGIDSGTAIGTVKEVSYYGGTGSENFKFVYGSDNQLDIYYANDPRATSYNTLNNFTATENSVGNGRTLTVTFHSAYINGNFYPCKEVKDVIAIRSTVTDQSQLYIININENGETVIEPKDGWTIGDKDLYTM